MSLEFRWWPPDKNVSPVSGRFANATVSPPPSFSFFRRTKNVLALLSPRETLASFIFPSFSSASPFFFLFPCLLLPLPLVSFPPEVQTGVTFNTGRLPNSPVAFRIVFFLSFFVCGGGWDAKAFAPPHDPFPVRFFSGPPSLSLIGDLPFPTLKDFFPYLTHCHRSAPFLLRAPAASPPSSAPSFTPPPFQPCFFLTRHPLLSPFPSGPGIDYSGLLIRSLLFSPHSTSVQ